MRNEDNDCIRYLMKEMDPSEELLMERAMMEDEDLLIEVESMRQTLKKLDKLPQKNPPSKLTDQIMQQAAEQAVKNRSAQKPFYAAYKYAVAATLALTITAGGTWFYLGAPMEKDKKTTQSSPSSEAQISQTTTPGSYPAESTNSKVMKKTAASTNAGQQYKVAPWVDRNQILRVEDYLNNSKFNALRESTQHKLKLIDGPIIPNQPVQSIQLTGAGN